MAMKRLLLLFLLMPLLAISLPRAAGDATQVIHDTEGRELSSHSDYHVLPVSHVVGGGLGAVATGSSCKFFVEQERNEAEPGLHVRFTPQKASSAADGDGGAVPILMSSDVGIKFTGLPSPSCVKSSEWYATDGSPLPVNERRQRHVAVGRQDAPPPPREVFRIERYSDDADVADIGYKLMSCDEDGCANLGLYAHEDRIWLTISDEPLQVHFKKAV